MHTFSTPPGIPVFPQRFESAPRIDSQLLLRGQRTIEIDHAGQRYTLRVTRENKLILTK